MSDEYYKGIRAFKNFTRDIDRGYDWADLSDKERARWAEIEEEQDND